MAVLVLKEKSLFSVALMLDINSVLHSQISLILNLSPAATNKDWLLAQRDAA